jgi:proteasome accessory factor C
MRYYSASRDETGERTVDPVRLFEADGRNYLEAWCRQAEGMRLFRLDRIDSFAVLDERFTLDERHALRQYSEDWKADAPEVRVRFQPAVERWVRERQPFTFVREEHDELGPIFIYAVRNEDDLVRWLLGWGATVDVLSPASLRARLAAEAWLMFSKLSATPDIRVSRAPMQAGVEA